jgi:hypothetical protein
MGYAMLIAGSALLLTCSHGDVSHDFWSKVIFRLIPLAASVVLLLNALNNLNVI